MRLLRRQVADLFRCQAVPPRPWQFVQCIWWLGVVNIRGFEQLAIGRGLAARCCAAEPATQAARGSTAGGKRQVTKPALLRYGPQFICLFAYGHIVQHGN